ncbi:MAG: hypothetical protein IT280_09160 [Ignavibacteria bacterium]|nr:hypothetical protein [Ignavibacteria bacterium]
MQSETIKTGKCPVCGSNEVYDNSIKLIQGYRPFINVSAVKGFTIITYVCINCGYFKEFIKDEDLKNEKLIKKVKENWHKTSIGKKE